ncbi:MAG: outer membrane lipid asymmetry maintenance protein MlaD [Proteobacteria bacterium]|nr:outer membrane lipid asymmetry maintenance protein MlaD [Desulfobacterales bacterium]MBL7173838.1 outer membrane lipid asymmetry maintenance protein MlaD [Desulfobacteraceae bacterium]MBU0988627.1 outer membrane lipid asymmetry maintenance protein MlaD [Pseudomonadota bacterium]MBU1904069.1 outer membrane lipid asymmetry maintenance protein MlaD [Pseudomonadota bacterium]
MKKFDLEFAVGLFMILGILCLGYLSIKLGKMEVLGGEGYEIEAIFSNSGGLKAGSSVVIAGVDVGRVKRIVLDDYQAKVVLNLPLNVKIQEDAIASIKTKGLIGEKYVEITPGGAEELLKPGGRIRDTQSAVDFEELISKYVFGKI